MNRIAAVVFSIALVGCHSDWHDKSESSIVSGSCTWKYHKDAWAEHCSRQVPHYHSSGYGKTRRTWTTYTTEFYTVYHPEQFRVTVKTREGTAKEFDNAALFNSTELGNPVSCKVVHSWEEHCAKDGKVDEGRDHQWRIETFWPFTGEEARQ